MKVLKFTTGGGGPQPEIYYLTESLRFHQTFGYKFNYRSYITENLGLRAILGSIYTMIFSEELVLSSKFSLLESFIEQLELGEDFYRDDIADEHEHLQLQEGFSSKMIFSFSFNENVVLSESGTVVLALVDYVVTWRTRTKEIYTGYGKVGYASDLTGYGSGIASEVVSFRVKVYNSLTNILLRNTVITIADRANPDDDATFTYTSAMNQWDNHNVFIYNLRFEVYQIDISGAESPAASINVTPIPHM
jgi:hypothetical protein